MLLWSPLTLQPWLEKFIIEFEEYNDVQKHWFNLSIAPHDLVIYTDLNHLHQVLWNLCTNAIKYADNKDNNLIVTLSAYTDTSTNISYLDVIDTGPGIKSIDQEKLFEPFYTTSTYGDRT